MNPLPHVDVVTLTWNDHDILNQSISSSLSSEAVVLELFVVDNGSEPPVVVPSDPRVQLIRNERNLGVSARNQGVEAGSSPFVCFVDSDAVVEADTIRLLLEPLLSCDDVALACPVFVGQSPWESAGRAPTVGRKLLRALGLSRTYAACRDSGPFWDVDFSISACWLFRRSAFEDVGGLDPSYFYGPEDVDFCLRLKEKGWRIVQVAKARCFHPPRRRYRRLLTRRGAQHAWALVRHFRRHRRFAARRWPSGQRGP